ncbi:hypothetical protein JOB18_010057 [Solea senegalensis]|uniref:Uncharacterized protein n=1 Tax=Solea senegalensis TaxID=28829 RepID=A0AAV6T4F4_SOLSE|nr:hypothetical protein JOB18_010057 [Solea senegalensis]
MLLFPFKQFIMVPRAHHGGFLCVFIAASHNVNTQLLLTYSNENPNQDLKATHCGIPLELAVGIFWDLVNSVKSCHHEPFQNSLMTEPNTVHSLNLLFCNECRLTCWSKNLSKSGECKGAVIRIVYIIR